MTIQELEQIIEAYGKSIYSFCLQLTKNKNTADDLYQETWLIACRNIKKIKNSHKTKSYLLSVAIGIWKNQKRKYAWRNRIAPQEELFETTAIEQTDSEQDALISYLDKERNNAVNRAIDSLDEKYRIPILLFYMEEMSLKEIAGTLNIPEGTVKSRLNYARKCLEKELEDYIDE